MTDNDWMDDLIDELEERFSGKARAGNECPVQERSREKKTRVQQDQETTEEHARSLQEEILPALDRLLARGEPVTKKALVKEAGLKNSQLYQHGELNEFVTVTIKQIKLEQWHRRLAEARDRLLNKGRKISVNNLLKEARMSINTVNRHVKLQQFLGKFVTRDGSSRARTGKKPAGERSADGPRTKAAGARLVVMVLLDGPVTLADILKRTGLSPVTVCPVLNRLERAGKAVKLIRSNRPLLWLLKDRQITVEELVAAGKRWTKLLPFNADDLTMV